MLFGACTHIGKQSVHAALNDNQEKCFFFQAAQQIWPTVRERYDLREDHNFLGKVFGNGIAFPGTWPLLRTASSKINCLSEIKIQVH